MILGNDGAKAEFYGKFNDHLFLVSFTHARRAFTAVQGFMGNEHLYI